MKPLILSPVLGDSVPSPGGLAFGPDNPWLKFTLYSGHRDSRQLKGAKWTDFCERSHQLMPRGVGSPSKLFSLCVSAVVYVCTPLVGYVI